MYARVKLVESTGRVLAFNLACFAIRSRIVELFILNSWSFREPYYLRFMISSCTGWWFGTMEFYDFPIILGISSSQLTPSFFRGVGQPPTRSNQWFPACLVFQHRTMGPLGLGLKSWEWRRGKTAERRCQARDPGPGRNRPRWELFHELKVTMEHSAFGSGYPHFSGWCNQVGHFASPDLENFCMKIMCLQWFFLKQGSLDGAVWGWRSSQMANFWELLWRKYVRHVALKAFHILQFSWIRGHCSNWLVNMFYFSIYWECHHPNWRTPSFFRAVGQPPTRYLYME